MKKNDYSYEIVIPLVVDEDLTEDQKKEIATVLDFPDDRQPDLLYFHGILVSSGENLNGAFFLPSELVKAEASIVNKPIDIEHNDEEIIGHIYNRAFIDKKGNFLDIDDLMSKNDVDSIDMDIAIAGVIYKDRFPKIVKEIKKGEWALSMETYYSDYDIKIGDLIFSRQEAEVLGLSDIVKSEVVFTKEGEEIAKGRVVRVLKNLTFCGCGIVKDPANPDSVFLDVASKNTNDSKLLVVDTSKLFEYAGKNDNSFDNNIDIKKDTSQVTYPATPDSAEPGIQTIQGQCPYFQRFDEDNKEVNLCKLYNKKCTSKLRLMSDKDCLYYKQYFKTISSIVEEVISKIIEGNELNKKIDKLNAYLDFAKKYLGG